MGTGTGAGLGPGVAATTQCNSSHPSAAAPPCNVTLLPQIAALAAPSSALSMLRVATQLVETGPAARQGKAALAGWAVVLPFALLLAQMSTGAMGGGVVAAVARSLGGQRRTEAQALVLHAMLITTGFGLLFAVGLSLAARLAARGCAGVSEAEPAQGGARRGWPRCRSISRLRPATPTCASPPISTGGV